jgi:hypothetical protein
MKNIIIILITLLSVSVNAQNIPQKYQGQYKIKHSWVEQCLSNLMVNPYQMFEMSVDEKKIYNKVVSLKKGVELLNNVKHVHFIQGVVKAHGETWVVYTVTTPGYENSRFVKLENY